MFDFLLNIGASADWVSPLWGFVQDLWNGSNSNFGIVAYAGWDLKEIKNLLKSQGIQPWGVMYNFSGDTLMLTVRENQAQWAYNVMQKKGVTFAYIPKEIKL